VIEGIKLVGAIVGIMTGMFILYDRILRVRPVVSLSPDGSGSFVLRVANLTEEEVLIEDVEMLPKSQARIASGTGLRDKIDVIFDRHKSNAEHTGKVTIGRVLKPMSSFDLQIVDGNTLPTLNSMVTFRVCWSPLRLRWLARKPMIARMIIRPVHGEFSPEFLGRLSKARLNDAEQTN
jgi:hypothetical protein